MATNNFTKNILIHNNYPNNFINKIFKQTIFLVYNKSTRNLKNDKTITKYIKIPNVNHLSEKIKALKSDNFNIANQNSNKFQNQVYKKLNSKIEKIRDHI